MWKIIGMILGAGVLALAAPLKLIEEGKVNFSVVTADSPSPTALYAAQELAGYMEKAAGQPVLVEKESSASDEVLHIYVGCTESAKKAGFKSENFHGESYVIKVSGNALFILGKENQFPLIYDRNVRRSRKDKLKIIWTDNGILRETKRGTLYGVYEFLDRFLGIRWLWPGDLGTYIPRSYNLVLSETTELQGKPPFLYRKYRIWHILEPYFGDIHHPRTKDENQLTFSSSVHDQYARDLLRYILIHQEGNTRPWPAPAEHFYGNWRKYGQKHPEWFAMRDDGKRGPVSGVDSRICASSPDFARFIVDQWEGGDQIGLGEADLRGFCRCPQCMAWDKPQPEGYRGYSTTNRYIRYAERVRELARKRNPGVTVSLLMYMDYIHPPVGWKDLSWIEGKFVPWGSGVSCWYPMSKKDDDLIRSMWDGWQKLGVKMQYRPNYLLSGYVMPALDCYQSTATLQFMGTHGMNGFDYDSLFGHWSTKGPMLYLHMRLGTNPRRSVESILQEYYAAFGPAAELVRKYFDLWNQKTVGMTYGGCDYMNAQNASEHYQEDDFLNAEKMLQEAMKSVSGHRNRRFVDRVAFLQTGLKHARLALRFSHLYTENRFEEALSVLKDMIEFRRCHEHEYFADLTAAQFTELYGYHKLGDFIRGKFSDVRNPSFDMKRFKRASVEELVNMKPGRWMMELAPDADSGHVVFKYAAGENNVFLDAELDMEGRNTQVSNRLEFSADGKNYSLIRQNVMIRRFNLTPLVQNRNLFYLRYKVVRRKNVTQTTNMVLYKFKMTSSRRFPDKIRKRERLNPGSGWMNYKGSWLFRKDIDNQGINFKEVQPEGAICPDWKQVEVPARLNETSIGPYLGYGWYASFFSVPEDWKARGIDLLFEAVDEQAWVYVNGVYCGEHTVKSEKAPPKVLWNEPFIIQIPANVLMPGKKNQLVVRTHASAGCHGIWKPVKMRPVDAAAR